MHLVVIAWLYVALMMAVAEATNSNGTVLGAIVTFLLYGLAPVSLVVYLMATPARRRAIRAREEAQRDAALRAAGQPSGRRRAAPKAACAPSGGSDPHEVGERGGPTSVAPDASGEAAADPVPPVGEKK
ncbi:MAG TPA: hypothetical protein VGI11_16270 [Variovorax sp.]|jgi:hypothetical protein